MREKIEEAIREWMVEYVHNSPVSRSNEAINHLLQSLPALEEKLIEKLEKREGD
jgi:hypothetical protein